MMGANEANWDARTPVHLATRGPGMTPTPGGWWRLPDTAPRIPLLYALLAGH